MEELPSRAASLLAHDLHQPAHAQQVGIADQQKDTSARLLSLCASGDASALRKLYVNQAPRLYSLAARITGDSSLAADALHDAFIQIWKHAGRYDANVGHADAWLTMIVRYRALDIKRLRWREQLLPDMPDGEDESSNPFRDLVRSREAAVVQTWLDMLAPHYRKVIISVYFDDMSQREVALKYDIPLGTIKSSMRRALLRLKAMSQASDTSSPFRH